MTADSIVREDPATAAVSPYASEVQLKGHVEIRMCSVLRPASKHSRKRVMAYMILHADEANYHGETCDFEGRGTVKVNFQNIQIPKTDSVPACPNAEEVSIWEVEKPAPVGSRATLPLL
jgi:hypothetical protein